ncbi:YdcH family protein [Jannaschia ovalis]|uniref:DUF465 domain-containing protein n=1 Tax=Jannaschia ovalis TaxID=3038773 RepID=A0ABY8LHB8_9RHOB|nr:DUF465 domain-containing protein [Jannaschia sp. GRR-S6-38]WGH79535.1 DUF465 domain-containing protein [Jannaschia sp. GRR-S6-38]
MSHVPHELAEEFPDATRQIATLKADSPYFVGLADRYHEVNRAIHRAETDIEPTSDQHMQEMRRERLVLKDKIAAALRSVDA